MQQCDSIKSFISPILICSKTSSHQHYSHLSVTMNERRWFYFSISQPPSGYCYLGHQRACDKLIGNIYIVSNSCTIFTFLNKRIKHDFGKVYVGHRWELHNYLYRFIVSHLKKM